MSKSLQDSEYKCLCTINVQPYNYKVGHFFGEEGKSTHRQYTQPVKIFTIGHFASICKVEKFGQTRLKFTVGIETACRNTSQNTKLKKKRFFGSQKCDLSYFFDINATPSILIFSD